MAIAWVPLRGSLPNTDVALVLVATTALVARFGGRPAEVPGVVSAAVSFGYLHTEPYGHWQIDHTRDVATTALIVLVGLLVGELTLRVFSHRAAAARGSRDLALLTDTAELMAVGDDPGLILAAVAGELTRLLGLAGCEYAAGAPSGQRPWVERDGSLGTAEARPRAASHAGQAALGAAPWPGDRGVFADGSVDLPVWVQGRVLGHYVLAFPPGASPAADRLALAVSLADQAGAALAGSAPAPPQDPPPAPRLRVVGPTSRA